MTRSNGRRLLEHRADERHRQPAHALDHVRRQDRRAARGIDDVGRDVGEARAAIGVFQERTVRVVAARKQALHLRHALVELVIAERANEVAFGVPFRVAAVIVFVFAPGITAVLVRELIEEHDRRLVLQQRRRRRARAHVVTGVHDERGAVIRLFPRGRKVRRQHRRAAHEPVCHPPPGAELAVEIVEAEDLEPHPGVRVGGARGAPFHALTRVGACLERCRPDHGRNREGEARPTARTAR